MSLRRCGEHDATGIEFQAERCIERLDGQWAEDEVGKLFLRLIGQCLEPRTSKDAGMDFSPMSSFGIDRKEFQRGIE